MGEIPQVMREAVQGIADRGICPFGQRLRPKVFQAKAAGQPAGPFNDDPHALSVAQYNAGLGRIVACPTAEAVGGTWCSAPHLEGWAAVV